MVRYSSTARRVASVKKWLGQLWLSVQEAVRGLFLYLIRLRTYVSTHGRLYRVQ